MNGGLSVTSYSSCRRRSLCGRLLPESCNYSKHQYLGSWDIALSVIIKSPSHSQIDRQGPQYRMHLGTLKQVKYTRIGTKRVLT